MRKRLVMIFALVLMAFTVASCDKNEEPNNNDSTNDSEKNENNDNNTNNNNNNQIIDNKTYIEGTDAAKLLLANERLDENVLKSGGNLFTTGIASFNRIISETRKMSTKLAGRENEAYCEVEGNTYKWYNDTDYANSMDFFDSYAKNIEDNAQRGSEMIDFTKKNIRVLDQWVRYTYLEYYLMVDDVSETIISRNKQDKNSINMCRRYTDEFGYSVYEMFSHSDLSSIRMKYIPGLVYEFSIMMSNMSYFINANNYKGYWEILCTSDVNEYNGNIYCYPSTIVLKEEASYIINYTLDKTYGDGFSIDIMSADAKTDIATIGANAISLYTTGFKGIDHLELYAEPENVINQYTHDDENIYIYADYENNTFSTSGRKSATVVLENGNTFTAEDMLIDGKVRVLRVDVSALAGFDAYGTISLYSNANDMYEQIEVIKELLAETGMTFRRDVDEVYDSMYFAVEDADNFLQFYKWNGYSINDLNDMIKSTEIERKKIADFIDMYNEYKDLNVIGFDDKIAMNESIHFAQIDKISSAAITNDKFNITIPNHSLKVTDTVLFVTNEEYAIYYGLAKLDENDKVLDIIPLACDENSTKVFGAKGSIYEVSSSASLTLPRVEVGNYALVYYVATKNEGIRVTKPELLAGEISNYYVSEYGYKYSIKSNDNNNLLLIVERDPEINIKLTGVFTYEELYQEMGEYGYEFGQIKRSQYQLEMLNENSWAEASKDKDLSAGKYRIKYIPDTDDEEFINKAYVICDVELPQEITYIPNGLKSCSEIIDAINNDIVYGVIIKENTAMYMLDSNNEYVAITDTDELIDGLYRIKAYQVNNKDNSIGFATYINILIQS